MHKGTYVTEDGVPRTNIIGTLFNKKEIKKLAADIVEKVELGDVILLSGEIGAGKTFFSRAFIASLFKKMNIPSLDEMHISSPTFNIMHTYTLDYCHKLNHIDLYRLQTPNDCIELGLEEMYIQKDILLIEWPERIGNFIDILFSRYILINICIPKLTFLRNKRDISIVYRK